MCMRVPGCHNLSRFSLLSILYSQDSTIWDLVAFLFTTHIILNGEFSGTGHYYLVSGFLLQQFNIV